MAVVTLTPWAPEHLPSLIEADTPEMTRYLGGPEGDDEVRRRHERYLRSRTSGEAWMYAIVVDGDPGGGIGFWPIEHDGDAAYETGWNVLPRFQGRGVAGAALHALIRLVAEEAPPRRRLLAYPSVQNEASNALCRAAGFSDLGERDLPFRGAVLRTRVWSLDLHPAGHGAEPAVASPVAGGDPETRPREAEAITDSQADAVWPVRTPRLQIRRCTPADVDAMWEWRRLPEVNRWLGLAPATREAFREAYLDPERLASVLVIELLPEDEGGAPVPIGDAMVRRGDGWAQREVSDDAKGVEAELGWVLDPAYAGRGYASEAVRAVIDVCFRVLGLRRVHAGCFAQNESSWRLMERVGMRREEFSRKTALHRSGQWLDGLNYGLLVEEWAGGAAPAR